MDLPITLIVGVASAVIGVAAWELVRRVRLRRASPSEGLSANTGSLGEKPAQPKRSTGGAAAAIQLFAGDMPVAEVVRFEAATGTRLEPIPVTPQLRAGMAAFLQQAPALASNTAQVLTNTFTLRFAPEISRGLADGTLSMMGSRLGGLRGNVVDGTGTIVGQASLDAAGKAATASLMVWQVLAIVTAQKFLSDINEKLAAIERGVEDIKNWLEEERQGHLIGDLQTLQSLSRSIAESSLSEIDTQSFVARIDAIEGSCRQVMATEMLGLAKIASNAETSPPVRGNLDEDSGSITKLIESAEGSSQRLLFAAAVRTAAAQVRASLPVARAVSRQRLAELAKELEAHSEVRGRVNKQLDRLTARLRGGFFTFKKTERTKRRGVRLAQRSGRTRVATTEVALASELASVQGRLGDGQSEVLTALVAETDAAGDLLRVSRVVEEPTRV